MGDLIDGFEPHVATSSALEHSSLALGVKVASAWLPTEEIERDTPRLREFNGLWAAPGSPYRSFAGMLGGIRLAREQAIPLLGTCGGFQHVVIEFARHVAGLLHADSQEHSPAGAADLVVTPGDACELAGKSMLVRLERGSLPHTIYGRTEVIERYFCRFAMNPAYRDVLRHAGLEMTGFDEHGEVRVIGVPAHPFFLATLYVPQTGSRRGRPHPLVSAFVRAAAASAGLVPAGAV
jgi:CTP synthase (UTP-ammonia lyase)